MRWFFDKLIELFHEVLINIYTAVTDSFFRRNVFTSLYLNLPSDDTGWKIMLYIDIVTLLQLQNIVPPEYFI